MKRLLPLLLMALLVGACGSTPATESPSVSPSASPVAEVSPTPSPLPSETPEPVIEPVVTEVAFADIAISTPLNMTSGLRDLMFDSRFIPFFAADADRLYFAASTRAPLTKGNDKGASKAGTYRIFSYSPSTNALSFIESIADPSDLYPAVTLDDPTDSSSTTSAASGFCTESTGDYRTAESGVEVAFVEYYYSNGTLKAYTYILDEDGDKSGTHEPPLNCEYRWAGDVGESGPWDDFYKKGHPAAVCPPDAPDCNLSDRQSKRSLYAMTYGPYDQVNSGRAAGTIAIYANGLSYLEGTEAPPDPDELRYYDQGTGVTGSILLDGQPLSGWATDAYLLGGQYYLLVQPYEGVKFDGKLSGSSRYWAEGPWVLVRIDPANPGVATAITVTH